MTIAKFTLLAVLSALIILLCLPNLEQSRQEARNALAFRLAQQIKIGALPADTVDPWGHKFEIQHTSSNVAIVTSFGSNISSPANGDDSDDISTSMSNPPHIRTRTRKRIQIFATLIIAASPWVLSLVLLIRSRLASPQRRDALYPARPE